MKLIKGKKNNPYGYTKYNVLCEVIKELRHGTAIVKILRTPENERLLEKTDFAKLSGYHQEFEVSASRFTAVGFKEYTSLL